MTFEWKQQDSWLMKPDAWRRLQQRQRAVLRKTTQQARAIGRGLARVDTGAMRAGLYIIGPDFDDYEVCVAEAMRLYSREEQAGQMEGIERRELEILDPLFPHDDDEATFGGAASHTEDWELGVTWGEKEMYQPMIVPGIAAVREQFLDWCKDILK